MDLEKAYEPAKYEAAIYKKWEESGAFKPADRGAGKPFCIIMPPPNANGKLHWGHAIGYTSEDVIIRYKRMAGFETLWLPGTDHAGIETQFVYERDVLAKEGKTRFDLGPDKFYQAVMEYTKQAGNTMINQFRAMGFSADWTKLKFTLDPDIIDIVYDTFIALNKDGHIYRGNRLVNWCPRCQAAFADIELDHLEREDNMYSLNYGSLTIATTRPETIFADVAVAVNPKDKRYSALVGKEAVIPLVNRPIPIIADDHVDPKTGTGALKVTPGHDQHDYEIGKRHNLPTISVIDQEGKLINVPDSYAGLSTVEARQKVAEALKADGKLLEVKPITHTVAIHERCGTVIEPLISEQWFLRVKALNQPTIAAFKNQIEVYPKSFTKIAVDWLENEHDWNISRQIWWGIRIPVYYKISNDPKKDDYLIVKTEAEASDYYGPGNYRAETDTFDTWFSSGQWPFATLMATGDFKRFYPTSLMGTAREILHKWVTRMVMLGLYRTGKIPFEQTYLWGLVTDEKGQKMSKSKGNVIDPLEITAQYGTDALRLAGTLANTPGKDSPMSEKQIEAGRNFCNKLWNVSRFMLAKIDAKTTAKPEPKNIADEWILTRLAQATSQITILVEKYRLNEVANALYHLVWDDLADWYVEASKLAPNPAVLQYALENILALCHPFIPFVTEAIWAKLPNRKDMLIISPWPKADQTYDESAATFAKLQALISEIRTINNELGLSDLTLYYKASDLIAKNNQLITKLAHLKSINQIAEGQGLPLVTGNDEAWLGVDHATIKNYKTTLEQKLMISKNYVEQLNKQLANAQFQKSAPKEVVDDVKHRQAEAAAKLHQIQLQLERLANF